MRQVTLHIPDNKYSFFIELVKSMDFVKKIEEEVNGKKQILTGIKQGVAEMNLVLDGKLNARDARDLINEL